MRAPAKNLSSSVTLQVHSIKINLVREMTKTNIHIVSIVGAVSLTEWIICFDIINHLCLLKLTLFVVKYNYKIYGHILPITNLCISHVYDEF